MVDASWCDGIPFHDATLLTITIAWEAKSLEARIRTQDGPLVLRATGLRRLLCPRLDEWGPSKAIYEIETPGPETVHIRMQSGDVIEIDATSFAVDGWPPASP